MQADDYINDPDFQEWINEISADCHCCSQCGDSPCGGVQSGGMCDNMPCHCDDWDDDDYQDEDPMEEAMDRCGRLPTGECTLVGTEHCDFDCPFRN